jgi:hypothetical protein
LGAADLPDEGDVTICATALNMCRFSGKYVRMMQVMPALSADALRALSGLYQLYMYIVFAVFHVGIEPGTPSYEQVDAGVQSSKLRRTLRFFQTLCRHLLNFMHYRRICTTSRGTRLLRLVRGED